MRKHYGWYIRGFNGASAIRKALVTATEKDEMINILNLLK
jgi:tRNA-dihydrouridine synthase